MKSSAIKQGLAARTKAVHSAGMNPNPSPVKSAALEPALPAALAELSSVLCSVEANQCGLYDRLHRVLESATDAESSCVETEAVGLEPPLVEIVYSLTHRLREVCDQQRDIIDRLQV